MLIKGSSSIVFAEISIKSGLVYQGKKFKSFANKVFYPGEIIFENIKKDTRRK